MWMILKQKISDELSARDTKIKARDLVRIFDRLKKLSVSRTVIDKLNFWFCQEINSPIMDKNGNC